MTTVGIICVSRLAVKTKPIADCDRIIPRGLRACVSTLDITSGMHKSVRTERDIIWVILVHPTKRLLHIKIPPKNCLAISHGLESLTMETTMAIAHWTDIERKLAYACSE